MVQIDGVTDSRLQQKMLDKIGADPIIAAVVREAACAPLDAPHPGHRGPPDQGG